MEGIWASLITELNKREIGAWISRRDLFKDINKAQTSETCDVYRNYLTQAGYLEVIGRGVYKRMKDIPKDLTITKCKEEAYGKSSS